MKKIILAFSICVSLFSVFAESNNIENYLKGNIADKTTAVRKATGKDAVWLSDKAINFVLESKEILGNDRELDGLAVAAILSFPLDYVKSSSEQSKEIILTNLTNLFEVFKGSTTVQTAIISKVSSFKNFMNISPFIKSLNRYISTSNLSNCEPDVINAVFNLLQTNGDNETFSIVYKYYAAKRFPEFQNTFENIIVSLLSVSMNEAVTIANSTNLDNVISFFSILYEKKSKINENSLSEIAVNVLSNTILLVKNSQNKTGDVTALQVRALSVLSENKWTRASSVVLTFFDYAKSLYDNEEMSDEDFVIVINSLNRVSPLEGVTPLVNYLGELNAKVEGEEVVSEAVVLAVINTLGDIGDKSAFDALLSVTYYNYPQSVLSAAREALAGLKW